MVSLAQITKKTIIETFCTDGGVMKKWGLFLLLLSLACTNSQIKTEFGPAGKTIQHGNIVIVIPEGAVSESVTIHIKRTAPDEVSFAEGTKRLKFAISILPDTLSLEKPMVISIPRKDNRERLAARIEGNYLPIADSWFKNETLHAKISHGGEYYLIETPEKYGILNASKTEEALLIISDLHAGTYLEDFRRFMKSEGYGNPIWTFIYPNDRTIEENAHFLKRELQALHEMHGPFRLDIVGFGIGGMIAARYGADTALYQHDISSAVVAIGTPFWGSALANQEKAKKAKSPYRFYFLDGLGENAKDLEVGSDLTTWLRENRGTLCWHHYDQFDENKNFASLRGSRAFEGELPEELEGDGLVSLSSTMLTFLEPEPFLMPHFQLEESRAVFQSASDFINLFRSFNWPEVFTGVWKGEIPFSRVNEIWEQEVKLHFRDQRNFQLLLDMNENMLLSVPENGILITNGDNDTYPAWYLQSKGVREDVLIANFSLLNVSDNIRYLKKNGLPIKISDEEIEKLRPEKTKEGKIVFVADKIVSMLMDNEERPVVFAATVAPQRMEGYELRMRGMVFEIGKGPVDIETTKSLFHSTFKLDNTLSIPQDSVNSVIEKMIINYHASLFKLVDALIDADRLDEALHEMVFVKDFPATEGITGYVHVKEATIRYRMGESKKGDEVLEDLLDKERNATIIKMVARTFHENDRKEKAIAVLADWLKEHPDDSEILKQLSEYGKEE
jgi:hypothetical protein